MEMLNFEQRNRVCVNLAGDVSQTYVARPYNVSKPTVSDLIRCVNVTGTPSYRPCADTPRVTPVRHESYKRCRHLRNKI